MSTTSTTGRVQDLTVHETGGAWFTLVTNTGAVFIDVPPDVYARCWDLVETAEGAPQAVRVTGHAARDNSGWTVTASGVSPS